MNRTNPIRKSSVLWIAAGLIVVLGSIMVPVLLINLDGWRKFAVIPVICVLWVFANYAFGRGVQRKE